MDTYPTLAARVAALRAKDAAGTLTNSDMVEFIKAQRAGRLAASEVSKVRKAKAEIRSAEDLLDDFN